MITKQNVIPRANKEPVHIRRNVEDYNDPYIEEEDISEISVCRVCGSVNTQGRWYPQDKAPHFKKNEVAQTVICPACRKQQDHFPAGVLTMTGGFVSQHKEEILNLIRNQSDKAFGINPLGRVMSIEDTPDGMELTTTNEKLAQRIGKALHKAYSGDIEYKWSTDQKTARVYWRREV